MAEKNNFRLDQIEKLLPEAKKKLLGDVGVVKIKMRLNTKRLGPYSIFRLTNISGNKFVFEVSDEHGYVFVVLVSESRKSFEDITRFGRSYIADPYIELGENLFFYPDGGQMQVVRNIQKIEILEEHICFLE